MTKKSVGSAVRVIKKHIEEFRRDAVALIEPEGLTTADVGSTVGSEREFAS